MSDDVTSVTLKRGKSGFGFNITGGKDVRNLDNDSGIFISRIREHSVAAEDGRMNVGDQILEVNGNSLLQISHAEALEYFLKSYEINLKILPLSSVNRAREEKNFARDKDSSVNIPLYLTGFITIAAISYVVFKHKDTLGSFICDKYDHVFKKFI